MGLLGLIPIVLGSTAHAQDTELTVESGLAMVTQLGFDGQPAGFMGAGLRHAGERFTWTASGALSLGGEGSLAGFGTAGAEFVPLAAPWWRSELSASLAQFGGAFGVSGTSRSLVVRQSVVAGPFTLWAGGALGDTKRSVLTSDNTAVSLGASMTAGPVVVSAEGRQSRTADWALLEAAGYALSRPASAYDLRDLTGTIRVRTAPFDWIVSGGWRRGAQATIGSSRAFSFGVQTALTPRVALTLYGGDQLADLVRGVPELRMVSAALRWRWSLGDDAAMLPAFAALGRALVERDAAGVTTLALEVDAPPDARVEYSASFTSWAPVPLARDGTRFHARLVLPAGTHRVSVRVNGGPWQPPAGMARVDDELGGAAGLVVVP